MEYTAPAEKPRSWASVASGSSVSRSRTPLTSKVAIPNYRDLMRLTDRFQQASISDSKLAWGLPSVAPEKLTARESHFPTLGTATSLTTRKADSHKETKTTAVSHKHDSPSHSRRQPRKKEENASSSVTTTLKQREEALAIREQELSNREQHVSYKEHILGSLIERLECTIANAVGKEDGQEMRQERQPSITAEVPQPWSTSDGLSEYLAASLVPSSEAESHESASLGRTSTSEVAASELSAEVSPLSGSPQQLRNVQLETATQLWYEPYGTDIEVLTKDAYGNQICLPLHRSIVEPRSGWIREQTSLAFQSPNKDTTDREDATQQGPLLLNLDVESSLATACFFFAYVGAQSNHSQTPSLSPGEQLLKNCSPNTAQNFDLSPVYSCIHVYDAALKLRMPELCCYILEQMETLATSVAESACVQRVRGPRFSIREVKAALEGSMAFIYTPERHVQWRPMQVAFAALYDAIALRVGPSFHPSHSEEMKKLVRRLHEDHIEYRQLQISCLPHPGSLVPTIEEMHLLLARDQDASFLWHGCDLHHDLYSEGGIHRLRNESSMIRGQNHCQKQGRPRSGSEHSNISVEIQL